MEKNNIICIDFNEFETFNEFSEFVNKNEKLKNIRTNTNISHRISYKSVFSKLSKIWILDDFILYIQHKGSDKMIINPELEKIVMERSICANNNEKDKDSGVEIILDINTILDRINDVGVEGLTLEEKEFLDKQN